MNEYYVRSASTQTSKQKISELAVFVLYVASTKGISPKLRAILSCFLQLKSVLFNLLCVLVL